MRHATDTAPRYLAMLEIIPASPNSLSTRDIQSRLADLDSEFNVDVRTIQRDLEKLSTYYPLSSEAKGRTNYWFWRDKSALIQLPAMGLDTALALRLAEDHLTPLLPPMTLDLLSPYFRRAHEVLDNTSLARWQKKVRVVRCGPPLQKPKIKKKVQQVIYQALLQENRFQAEYEPLYDEPKSYPVNPLGLVSKGGILYLVATVYEYQDIRQFALHRFNKAALLEDSTTVPRGFNLDHYIEEESGFDYPASNEPIKLTATVSEHIAYLLEERPLSDDQEFIEEDDAGNWLVEATVKDTMELRWWLRSLGNQILIRSPTNYLH